MQFSAFLLQPVSFLQIQIRVANALIGLVPIFGWPAIIGITLGVFIGNLTSPLGIIDLFSTIPSFIGLYIVWRIRNKSVIAGLVAYTILLSLWVSFMLSCVLGILYFITLPYLTAGIGAATVGLGYSLYRVAKKVTRKTFQNR